MAHFLSRLHADLRAARTTLRGATHRPEDVPTFRHKEYARMPLLPLPAPEALAMTIAESLERRRSTLSAGTKKPLTMQECGTLFGLALHKRRDTEHRNYPSAGALYPIETYLISSALEGQEPAVLHYNPTKHALERLWNLPDNFDIKEIIPYPESLTFSAIILFTSVWQRSAAKYGDVSYLHALLEAGHMSENVLLVGAALGLDTRPMAAFEDDLVIRLLHLDEGNEQPVHAITLAKM